MNIVINSNLTAIKMNKAILNRMDLWTKYNYGRKCFIVEIKNFFKPMTPINSWRLKFKKRIINELIARDTKEVSMQWKNIGINQEVFEDLISILFANDEYGNSVCNKVIPSDSAEILFFISIAPYIWEELQDYFKIDSNYWIYAYFFPEKIDSIPSSSFINENYYDFFFNNFHEFKLNITIETVVKVILLYGNQ